MLKQWPVARRKIVDKIRPLSKATAMQMAEAGLFLSGGAHVKCKGLSERV